MRTALATRPLTWRSCAIAQARVANGTGVGVVRKITGSLTIFNSDGTAGDSNIDVGESTPMEVRLTSPATVDGMFGIDYDPDYFSVSTDAAGENVVQPDAMVLTPSTAGQTLYVWGVAPTSDPDGSDISLVYDATAQPAGPDFFGPQADQAPAATPPVAVSGVEGGQGPGLR